ncbi:GNAT family N-acetyltransferase [Rhodopirellula europaea]|uniref:GCN5-related N-acetyltransferase n=1 Tax=Rhodopirellula europaea 6C TaxID=1263867 RepID=M2AHB3_9BACT|nr:GNAT family N-acetyltransferase [Rhodopirellula europaea]EMB16495.1 GCN5-related N-acetyltransferase [Rhodopirellula europaea 6C]
MSGVRYPDGWRIELLTKSHNRRAFQSGQEQVDGWLKRSALQSQKKHLSSTKVLLDEDGQIIGYYTLASSQVDFSDLPTEVAKSLPQRQLPVAVLAWLGVDSSVQGRGIGSRLLATALRDCHEASKTFAFIAVILDCVDESSKAFYGRYDFAELPGYPMRLYLPFKLLEKLASNGRGTK